MGEFLDTFEMGGVKDGHVTMDEFINYYTNLGASIDSEEYFELMIRNAWHISGGEGAAANSSNLRVLVTSSDGSERVVALEKDLGLRKDDQQGLLRALNQQGIKDVIKINGIPVKGADLQTPKTTGGTSINVLKAPPIPGREGRPNATGLLEKVKENKQKEENRKKEEADRLIAGTLVEVVRAQLLSRGISGVVDLQRTFSEMDKDGDKSLSRNEFKNAMIASNLTFSGAQLDIIFNYFGNNFFTLFTNFYQYIMIIR